METGGCVHVFMSVGAIPAVSANVGHLHVGRRTFSCDDELQSPQDASESVSILC